MTQKDFKEIARILRNVEDRMDFSFDADGRLRQNWVVLVDTFTAELQRANPRFKEHLFRKAVENGVR